MTTTSANAARIIAALDTSVPGSSASVRGSIAAGRSDAFSDIDLEWRVGADASGRVASLARILATVDPVESLRWDPESAAHPSQRLVFVRFAAWSLFQRVDLEIVGRFGDAASPSNWSPAESALMNAVAAVKAVRRGRGDVDGLLARGFARVGAADPGGLPAARIRFLVDAADASGESSAVAALAARIRAELLG